LDLADDRARLELVLLRDDQGAVEQLARLLVLEEVVVLHRLLDLLLDVLLGVGVDGARGADERDEREDDRDQDQWTADTPHAGCRTKETEPSEK